MSYPYAIINTSRDKEQKMNKGTIKERNGEYLVFNGYDYTVFTSKREAKRYAKRYSFTLGYVAMALLGLSAVLQIVALVLRVANA